MAGRQSPKSPGDPFNSPDNGPPANAPRAPAGFRAREETNTQARTHRAAHRRFVASSERRAADQSINPRPRAPRSRSGRRRAQAEQGFQDTLSNTERSALEQPLSDETDGRGRAGANADPVARVHLPTVKHADEHEIYNSANVGGGIEHSAQETRGSSALQSPGPGRKVISHSPSQEFSPASGFQGHFRRVNNTSPSLAAKISQQHIPHGRPSTPTRASFKPAVGQTKAPSVFSPYAPTFRPAAGGNDHLPAMEIEWMAHMGLGPLSCRACGADMSCEVDGVTLRCEKCRRTR